MNPAKPYRSLAVALLVMAAIAVPAFAKNRAVGHRTPPGQFSVPLINGTVVDNVTGQPVIGAEVSAGGNRFDATDTQGRFDLKSVTGFGTIVVTVARSGYQPTTASVTPTGATTLTIRMTSTPTTTVRLVTGETKVLDTESIKFGYPVFTGYVESESEDFCKITDSTQVTIHRSQMAKVTGPAQTVSAGACCTGNAQKMTLTLKTGEVMEVIFTDTCQERYKVDVDGRLHVSGQFEHIPIENIAEIVFP
ncbi:MAG TPA: carboxypeptidase-like regulatory domain-containing protein [Thermoanaerobaculia bacterium]|nr:carboxypeptidase-like regulatory domain-containing protein [Thermoanaerobaculia bacterium]